MTDKNDSFESDQLNLEDNRGFAEIEAAFKEIERIKNSGEVEENPQEEDPQGEAHSEDEETEDEFEEEGEEENSQKDPLKDFIKKPEKAWKEKKRRFKAQAETRIALEEKRLALEENVRLKELLKQAEAAGTYQYGKNVYSELEKAKQLQRKAIDDGDADGVIEAGMNVSRALNNIMELEKWSAYESTQPQKQQEPNPSYQNNEGHEQQIAQKWLSTHKELQHNSRHYDPELTEEVGEFIHELDSKIDKSGNTDVYFSDDYFEAIDDYIEDLKSKKRTAKTQKNIGSISNVGSVRNSYSNSLHSTPTKPQKIFLTPFEKDMAQRGGISEEAWAKRKANLLKKSQGYL
jgi:hypothetical protein